MLNLDTRIPLMVQERDYGRGFDMMQKAQENQLRLQALRDEYNAAKGERDRQKAIRQGMAIELQKMQQGTPGSISHYVSTDYTNRSDAKRHDRRFSVRTWTKITTAGIVW